MGQSFFCVISGYGHRPFDMTAGANKFLRIYYGKVNAFLAPKEDGEAEADESDS